MKALLAASLIALGGLASAANAQSASPAAPAAPAATPQPEQSKAPNPAVAKIREACAGDVQKFCADAEKGKGKIRACLKSHEGELSAGCKEARAARAAEGKGKKRSKG